METRKESVNDHPGPGAHQPVHTIVKSKSSSHSMAYKYDSALEDKRKLPGPGEYNIEIKPSIMQKQSKFGTSKRQSLGGDPTVPGPGQY